MHKSSTKKIKERKETKTAEERGLGKCTVHIVSEVVNLFYLLAVRYFIL